MKEVFAYNRIQFFPKSMYKYLVAGIYTTVLFLDRLDLTIVNIILPTLAVHFNVLITQTQSVATSFLLALVVSIPISGWASDFFGTKKVFIFATIVFGVSSFICPFSPSLLTLNFFRFMQGLGGGLIIPVGMTMVYRAFPPTEYAKVTSFTFIPSLIAPAIAPFLGGLIQYFLSWQWVFLFSTPICLIIVIASIFILREEEQAVKTSLDVYGFALSCSTLITLLLALSLLEKNGFNLSTGLFLFISIVLLMLFIFQEKRTKNPLIHLKLFSEPLFTQANLIQLCFQICHFGSFFLIGMYLQVAVGMSAIISGLIMGMQAIGAMCINRYSAYLFQKVGPSTPIICGLIGIAFCSVIILSIRSPHMVVWGGLIFFVRGLASGLCGTPIQTSSVINFNKNDLSRASAIFNTTRQVSISLGISFFAVLITYGFKVQGISLRDPSIFPFQVHKAFEYGFFMIPVIAIIGVFLALTINNKRILEKIRS